MDDATACNSRKYPEDQNPKFQGGINNECSMDINNSIRLNTSTPCCSSISSESDLSFSLLVDREVENCVNRINSDELPAFEIRLISPLGRSPSPIDSEVGIASAFDDQTPDRRSSGDFTSSFLHNPNYVTLQDINAQISPPNNLSISNSLETIYEGVFLNTPPRKRVSLHHSSRNRPSMIEKVALNRIHAGKENHSPVRFQDPQRCSISITGDNGEG